MKLHPQIMTDIADFINAKNGAHVSGLEVSQHFHLSTDSATRHLRELVGLNLIAVSGKTRIRSYSKIMPEQVEIGQPSRVFTCAPLAVNKQRSELYEQLAAARQAIPSIG